MKPIEPGCLALLINLNNHSELNGTVCQVVQFLGQPDPAVYGGPLDQTGDYWEVIDAEGDQSCARERNLMRIDDDGELADEEQREELTV
jgi:hypothetical protein